MGNADTGGHRRFVKTALKALTSRSPHVVVLTVPANDLAGQSWSTAVSFAAIARSLGARLVLAVTKLDLAAVGMDAVRVLPALPGGGELVEAASPAEWTRAEDVAVFFTSSVSGEGVDALRSFLLQLRAPAQAAAVCEAPLRAVMVKDAQAWDAASDSDVDDADDANAGEAGMGNDVVVAVSVQQGALSAGQSVRVGPVPGSADFCTARVASLHTIWGFKPVDCAGAGTSVYAHLRLACATHAKAAQRGGVLAVDALPCLVDLTLDLDRAETLRAGEQCVAYAGAVTAAVSVLAATSPTVVTIRFAAPQAIAPGTVVLLRRGAWSVVAGKCR